MALDTSVKHYTNTMNSAPSLINSANSLIQLLDAVLVNGFGSQTVTSIVVANSIATVTVSTGYAVPKFGVVTISGATPVELNGDKKVLSSTANNVLFTYDATGISDQVATGTITVRFPGAGWTKPYANTTANVAVYRNDTANGTGIYVRVADSGTTVARLIAYETMTDENTGTNQCPLTAQISGGIYIAKSNNATPKKWWIIADSKVFYLASATSSIIPDQIRFATAIGDFKPYYVNDNYNFLIIGREGDSTVFAGTGASQSPVAVTTFQPYNGLKYVMRNFSQTPGSREFTQNYLFDDLNGMSGSSSGIDYPQLPKNTVHFSPNYIIESSCIRGEFYGVYSSGQNIRAQNLVFLDDDIVLKDDKYYLYKALEFGASSVPSGRDGAVFFDISGPWT